MPESNWKQILYQQIMLEYGVTETWVSRILSSQFSKFEHGREDEYKAYIQEEYDRQAKHLSEELKKKWTPSPTVCSVCGEPAVPDILGWRCNGSLYHALLWHEAGLRLSKEVAALKLAWCLKEDSKRYGQEQETEAIRANAKKDKQTTSLSPATRPMGNGSAITPDQETRTNDTHQSG